MIDTRPVKAKVRELYDEGHPVMVLLDGESDELARVEAIESFIRGYITRHPLPA